MATLEKPLIKLIAALERKGLQITGTRHHPSTRCNTTGQHYGCSFGVDTVDPISGYPKVYYQLEDITQ